MPDDTIDRQTFTRFQRLIHGIAGISLADSKQVLLVGRLQKRLHALGIESFADYYRHVTHAANADELEIMVNLLTTNETYFFREESHFDFLRESVIPHHPAQRPLEIWSAAASTGEEIYTICMVLADALGIGGPWRVLGSDLSTAVLATARRGLYWLDRTRGLPRDYLHKYCLKGTGSKAGTFLVQPQLRQHTRFMQANLNEELPDVGGPFDVIFLRNVMIYFNNETKRQVVARVAQRLRPGGYLLIGHSETLTGVDNSLIAVRPTIYRRPAQTGENAVGTR